MSPPAVRNILLLGAGHAHVEVLRAFAAKPEPSTRLTLVTREANSPYSGMLPGFIAGHYGFEQAHIHVAPLAQSANAELYLDEACGIDLAQKRVLRRGGPPLSFDILSIDIGSRPNTFSAPGADEHAIPVKPIDGFIEKFEALRNRVAASGFRARICMVGAGAGGVELLLSAQYRLLLEAVRAGKGGERLSFALITGANGLLPSFAGGVRRRVRRILLRRGMRVHERANVAFVERGKLHCEDGSLVEADEILWTTQASAAPWLRETGLALDGGGFLRVDSTLRCEGRNDVFAAGDIADFGPRALPKAGVYAVRAGPVLAHNLHAAATSAGLREYKPQRRVLSLISMGDRRAIGSRNGFSVEGEWVWQVKDWIDRRFMARYRYPEN